MYLYITPLGGINVLSMQNLADILVLHQQSSEIDGVEDVLSVAGFFDDALRDSGTTLNEVNSQICHEYEDSNGNGKYDEADEVCTRSNWDEVWDSIKTSNQEGNYTWDDVAFAMDVLVNRDMNMNPLLLQELIKNAHINNTKKLLINNVHK